MALTGAGGGVLGVPALVIGLHLSLVAAAPVALVSVGVAAALGTIMGLRTRHVRYRAAALMAAVGLLGAPVGVWLARVLPTAHLTLLFAAVLAYVALRMYRTAATTDTAARPPRAKPPPCALDPKAGRLRWTPACARALGLAGAAAGLLSAMLGVGGGFVIVPALRHVTDLDTPSVTATSLAVVALVSVGGICAMLLAGQDVRWSVAVPFSAGALVGLVAGRHLAARVSGRHLQQTFAALALVVAVVLVVRALPV